MNLEFALTVGKPCAWRATSPALPLLCLLAITIYAGCAPSRKPWYLRPMNFDLQQNEIQNSAQRTAIWGHVICAGALGQRAPGVTVAVHLDPGGRSPVAATRTDHRGEFSLLTNRLDPTRVYLQIGDQILSLTACLGQDRAALRSDGNYEVDWELPCPESIEAKPN